MAQLSPVQMSKGKDQRVTFDQFSLSEEFPFSQKVATPEGKVSWGRKWVSPAAAGSRQDLSEHRQRPAPLRFPEDSPSPPRVQLRVGSFLQVDGFPHRRALIIG